MINNLISVVLPNFNHQEYLEQAIDGILGQSYRQLELVVVDDGSTDSSPEIIRRYSAADSRIHPIFLEKNSGAVVASSVALRACSGEFLYQAAADDFLIDGNFFANSISQFECFPTLGAFVGKSLLVDPVTQSVKSGMGYSREGIVSGPEFISGFLDLSAPFFVPGASAILRRSAITELGDYDYALGAQIDYFINHAVPALHGMYFQNRWVAAVRVFENRESFSGNVPFETEVQRFRTFALKMRSLSHDSASAEDWSRWWRNRFERILRKHFPCPPI